MSRYTTPRNRPKDPPRDYQVSTYIDRDTLDRLYHQVYDDPDCPDKTVSQWLRRAIETRLGAKP